MPALVPVLVWMAATDPCPVDFYSVFADQHDGDKKAVNVWRGAAMVIRPVGNATWLTSAAIRDNCSASVDFNVPGKPSPPPVNLTATFWFGTATSAAGTLKKTSLEFTDPSGTLAAASFPLNRWVQLDTVAQVNQPGPICPHSLQAVFADMHDGDKKEISISGTSMTIRPAGNNQTWSVKSTIDQKFCNASIDFNVPGKPGPPPVSLTATLWKSATADGVSRPLEKNILEFTDPSGTLAAADFPLNTWVQLSEAVEDIVTML
eukprot:TRINITY_DN25019_c0_g2_i1.p1 TRINITY_DN25019_c0_g2~~TRINITY_DN25019_c0_g2_i1.p1  ORF type:complete len:262 (-),score=51.99 TRINITY_DN25019_c0_g2_i1:178-963(-)